MSSSYRPEIDGLRAIAVVSVVLFHADVGIAAGGYIGVDIFFVISGFLITSILLKDLSDNQSSILKFYERRARRIAPALIVAVLLTIVAAPLFLVPDQIIEVYESATATALFIANVRFWRSTDYFATAAEERPLLHMWSLAVEEQYYIVFPVLLFLLWPHLRTRLLLVFGIIAVLSLAIAEIGWRIAPTANFYLPMSRAWELLAGSMLAVHIQTRQPEAGARSSTLALAGLVMILVPIFAFDKFLPTPSVYLLVPVIGVCLVIRHAEPRTIAARILSLRPMVAIGLISYSMYLYHQPLLAYGRLAWPASVRPDWFLPFMAVLSVPLGYLSWRFVEQPTRRRMSVRSIWIITGLGLSGIAALGIAAHLNTNAVESVYVASLNDEGKERYQVLREAKRRDFPVTGECRFQSQDADAAFEVQYDACLEKYGPGIIVLGGSHAHDLFGVLSAAFEHPFIVSLTKGFCRPHKRLSGPPPHPCHYDGVLEFAERRNTDIQQVIYTQPFFTLFDAYRETRSTEGFHPELAHQAIAYLASLQAHVPVVMLGPRRTPGFTVPNLSPRRDFAAQANALYNPGTAAAEELADQVFRDEAQSQNVPYVSLITLLDQQLPDEILVNGKLMYHDGDHLNAHGERIMGRKIRHALGAAGATVERSLLTVFSKHDP